MSERIFQLMFKYKSDEDHVREFNSKYSINGILWGTKKTKVFDDFSKIIKTCRFCGKTVKETTFKQETHVIPQLLNKAKPISNFECDKCNQDFSKLETDFSSYFILHRALFGHKKKDGKITKLKTKDGVEIQGLKKTKEDLKRINISEEEINQIINSNHNILMLLANGDEDGIEISDNGSMLKISILRPGYTPLKVYKTLLKIALSIIPQSEFDNFKNMLNILNSDTLNLSPEILNLLVYSLSKYNSYFNFPMVMQCDRTSASFNCPSKIVSLYIDNKIIQIPIYSDDDFIRINSKGETFNVLPIPPIINPLLIANQQPNFEFHKELAGLKVVKLDLSSDKLIKGEKDEILILKDSTLKVITNNISIIKSEIINQAINDQNYGFIFEPNFATFGKVELKIIFDLLIPISNSQHIHIKSGSYYSLINQDKFGFIKNIEFLENILQETMNHNVKMFHQQFPQYSSINIRTFDKEYFTQQIEEQLIERGLTLENMVETSKLEIII